MEATPARPTGRRPEPRPRRPAGQSAPAALTDGPAGRSRGGPARAPRWAGGAEARAGPAPCDPAARPSSARFPGAAGTGRATGDSQDEGRRARCCATVLLLRRRPCARRFRGPRRAGPCRRALPARPRGARPEIHPDSRDSVPPGGARPSGAARASACRRCPRAAPLRERQEEASSYCLSSFSTVQILFPTEKHKSHSYLRKGDTGESFRILHDFPDEHVVFGNISS